jgi:hypothetical protein
MVAPVYIMVLLVSTLVLEVVEVIGKKVPAVVHLQIQVVAQEVEEIITQMVVPAVTAEAAVVEAKHFNGDHGIILHHHGVQEPVVEEVTSD